MVEVQVINPHVDIQRQKTLNRTILLCWYNDESTNCSCKFPNIVSGHVVSKNETILFIPAPCASTIILVVTIL